MRNLFVFTPAEKSGTVDGIGLFFGALLGTNLGSFTDLNRLEYTLLIVMLAGTVMALRMFSTTERRWYGYLLLALYTLVVVQFLFWSKLSEGIALADRERLAITLAVWVVTIVMVEITPTRELPDKVFSESAPPQGRHNELEGG